MAAVNQSLRSAARAAASVSTLLGLAMIAILWAGTELHLASERRISLDAAVQNSGNLARAFEEHLVRSIREVDSILLFLRRKYEEDAGTFDPQDRSTSEFLLNDIITRIGIITPDGLMRPIGTGVASPVSFRDREHFQVHIQDGQDALFIGRPIVSRFNGEWVIPLSRRIRDADGSFGGVIAATIDTAYFTQFYKAINVGPQGAIALIGRLDGVFRASESRGGSIRGQTITDFNAFRLHLTAPEGWYLSDAAWGDGVQRLISFRSIDASSLAVMVGLSQQDVFTGLTAKQSTYITVLLVVTGLILLIIALNMLREIRRARAERELDHTRRFLDVIIEKLPLPIVVKDPTTSQFLLVNQAYEAFMGMSRRDLIGGGASKFFPNDTVELIRHYDAEALKHKDQIVTAELRLQTADKGPRTANTTRLIVRDAKNDPQYLIVLVEDITERKAAEAQIVYMAHHDALTGLPNRTRFAERLNEALAVVNRGGQLAVLFLDLDHFKHVNDTLGHLAGDELLKEVAGRLRGCVRESDLVARLGGDEFAIIQTSVKQPADVASLTDRIQEAIKAPYDLQGLNAVIDVSIGIALAPGDGCNPDELMKRADMALYQAKTDGRNTWRYFEAGMDARMKSRRRLEFDLRNALMRGELALHYQPVVRLRDDAIVGLEALLRWQHPDHGLIPPSEFIPVAEETGLIVPLGEWVLCQACVDAAGWPSDIRVAVNLSPAQFRSPDLTRAVAGALAASGLAPSRLELEITEAVLLAHDRGNVATLERLRAIGARIAMDDFGTGYSSLNYLRRFPFDKIKIDRSFVKDLKKGNDVALAIVETVARLAETVGMSSTAEGVETEEQLNFVRALGCTEYQGYLFSPPRSLADIERLFLARAESSTEAA